MELKNFSYLLINLFIILGPLILSFEKGLYFWGKIKYVIFAILASNLIFITWDAIATYLGHWNFSGDHITGLHLGNLPIEEVLFFFTANYATLFMYEVFVERVKPSMKSMDSNKVHYFHIFLLFLFIVLLLYLGAGGYTAIALSLTVLFLLIETLIPFYARIEKFYIYLLSIFIVFLIFNSILTGIPIVSYDPAAIVGFRLGTIPAEDVFFNYLMVLSTLRIYLFIQKRVL